MPTKRWRPWTCSVRDFLERYRRAVEAKNIDEVAALYVSFSERQRAALRGYLASANDLTVELDDIVIRRRTRTSPSPSPAAIASPTPRAAARALEVRLN